MSTKRTSRLVVKAYLAAGALFILLGFGQFFFFLGLDRLGLIDVGNALGHGLLLYLAVAVGIVFIVLGLLLAALIRDDKPAAGIF